VPVGKIVYSRHDIMTRPWRIPAFHNVLLPFNFINDHHQVYSVKMSTGKGDRSSLKEFLAVRRFSQINTPLRNSSQKYSQSQPSEGTSQTSQPRLSSSQLNQRSSSHLTGPLIPNSSWHRHQSLTLPNALSWCYVGF
jgi:hypothetical protein